MKNLLISSILIFFLLSCEKDVRTKVTLVNGIKNIKTFTPSTLKPVKCKYKKLLEINGTSDDLPENGKFNWSVAMDADNDGNIYVVDVSSSTIKKFSKDGEFIKQIGKMGTGPGELSYPNTIGVLNNNLYTNYQRSKKMIKFDLDGSFVKDLHLPEKFNGNIQFLTSFSSYFLGLAGVIDIKNNKTFFGFDLTKFDKDFKAEVSFKKNMLDITNGFQNVNVLNALFAFTGSDSKIYAADNSENAYHINCYNLNGDKEFTFEKSYRQAKFLEEEIEAVNKMLAQANRGGGARINAKVKKSIVSMYYDKYENVLVRSAREYKEYEFRPLILDVFSKDGEFKGYIDLDFINDLNYIDTENILKFKNGLLYILSIPNQKISVYDYNYNL